ncbi:hypothetical protein OROMI_032066 [Orobanche minor]
MSSSDSSSFLRQLSNKEGSWISILGRWGWDENGGGGGFDMKKKKSKKKKRVMVVVDETSHSKHAMMWALTHLITTNNNAHILTLLHIVSSSSSSSSSSPYLATTLGSLCKASKPEVEVEALVIQGQKMGTVISQSEKAGSLCACLGSEEEPFPLDQLA